MPDHPTPHGDKLAALANNAKLPTSDRVRVNEAMERYKTWTIALSAATGDTNALLAKLVAATNDYKFFIEHTLIFSSENDFLYRQKGQLKLDNSILEEFLPRLVDSRLVPGLKHFKNLVKGPQQCFAALTFGPFHIAPSMGGVFIKTKDQDFVVARSLHLRASETKEWSGPDVFESSVNVAYFAAELKTNLDKTMFQEAAATARDLKAGVLGATYVILCEWLDMPPIDTRITPIDEVILLRKAKRLDSRVRESFSLAVNRKAKSHWYADYLKEHPLAVDSFARVVARMNRAFPTDLDLDEGEVLTRGFF